jgi:hypothetical protein
MVPLVHMLKGVQEIIAVLVILEDRFLFVFSDSYRQTAPGYSMRTDRDREEEYQKAGPLLNRRTCLNDSSAPDQRTRTRVTFT